MTAPDNFDDVDDVNLAALSTRVLHDMVAKMTPEDRKRYRDALDSVDAPLANLLGAALGAPEPERNSNLVGEFSKIIHDMIVAQQAAWIEWRHGAGADAAMKWIENGLRGPGHIPDANAPYGTEAQAFFDANQADPFPPCHCGRPSNILYLGNGFCSTDHYGAAIAAQQDKGDQA